MSKELLIFVGHSADAKAEVEAVCTLEGEFQKFLRRHVKNIDFSTTSVKMFIWENDADTGVGGQKFAINPYLESADIALFIFKERVGKVTWEELQYCRENHIRTIVIFPAEPPYPDKLNEELYVDQWMDLIKKKKSLTENWSSENSDSITPVDPYKNLEDLKDIVREKISDLIPDVVFMQIEKRSEINNDSIKSEIQKFSFDLNDASGTIKYSSKIVLNYRSKLREEYKLKYPVDLSDIPFLTEMGFIKNDKLTLVGVLLFTDKPAKILRSAVTRASKYEGGTKSSSNIRMDIDESIINQILISREFIENHIESRDTISGQLSESKKIFKYPMKCIREVLANAVCHRDYSDNSRFVYVTIYNDRIEISNPGEWGNRILTEGKSILFTDLQGRPVEKNLSLARAISAINFMEMEGSGIATAISNCIDEAAPIPSVVFENGFITVTIFPRKNWDIYNLSPEIKLGEIDTPILLDRMAAKSAIEHHLQFVNNWAKEIGFHDMSQQKSVENLTVDINLQLIHFNSGFLEENYALINLSDLLSQNNNCYIVGQPGSGKTTAIKILANSILNTNRNDSKFNLPIVIQLRELRANAYFNFYTFLVKRLGLVFRVGGKELNLSSTIDLSQSLMLQIKKELMAFFEENKALLFLDGMDEIADRDLRELVLNEISDLSYGLNKSKIILTSRTGLIKYHLQNFTTYEIVPLTNSQINDFIVKWLGTKSNDFINAISNPPFSESAKSPLLMAHFLAIFERYGKLPDKPKSLYRNIVQLLLEDWDSQRGILRNSKYASFEVDRKFDFLTAISFSLTSRFQKAIFSKSDLQLVYESIAEKYHLPKNEAADVVDELESTTGIFVQTGFGTYEFSHKSIQEYLCAEYMVKRPNSWDSIYLNLPNELAIATSLSANSSFYFINIIRHLDEEIGLNSQYIVVFINRIILEKIDFAKSTELTLSFYFLLTKLIVFNQTEMDILTSIEKSIALISSQEINLEIKEIYEETNLENLIKQFSHIDFNSINLPENFKWYRRITERGASQILKNWPGFIVLNDK